MHTAEEAFLEKKQRKIIRDQVENACDKTYYVVGHWAILLYIYHHCPQGYKAVYITIDPTGWAFTMKRFDLSCYIISILNSSQPLAKK